MKYTSIFYKLRDKLPDQMLREIYYAFTLQRVQNAAARLCLTYVIAVPDATTLAACQVTSAF